MDVALLVCGDDILGRLEDVRPDMPWFEARFVATNAFADVEHLFHRELELVESGDALDVDGWEAAWEQIWGRGVGLVLPDGTRLDRDFAVHVYDNGTARFRY